MSEEKITIKDTEASAEEIKETEAAAEEAVKKEAESAVSEEVQQASASIEEAQQEASPEKDEKTEKRKAVWKEILSWVEVIVIAVVIALIVNNFIIANSTVPTSSMENTIMTNDRVIGTRLSYTVFGEPKRGDVAIFKFGWICEHCKKARGEGEAPEECPLCHKTMRFPQTMYYVKRIIGEPGDTVEIRVDDHVKIADLGEIPEQLIGKEDLQYYTGAVYINGAKLEEDYLMDPMLFTGNVKLEVPEGCYLFLGDNRNNSNDSRFWDHPFIEKKNIIAKVQFRYFPGFKKIQ